MCRHSQIKRTAKCTFNICGKTLRNFKRKVLAITKKNITFADKKKRSFD